MPLHIKDDNAIFPMWVLNIPLFIIFSDVLKLKFYFNQFILIGGQLLYNIVVALPPINMNQPRVYMCPPSRIPFPPSSWSHPSGLSQCTGFECPVSSIKFELSIYFTYNNNIFQFSQISPPSPSQIESKSLLFISVSLLLFHI